MSHKSRRWESWRSDKTFPSFSTRPACLGTCRSQLDRATRCRPRRGTSRAAGQPLLSQLSPAPSGAGVVTPRSRSAASPSPWAQPSPIPLRGSGQGDARRNELVGLVRRAAWGGQAAPGLSCIGEHLRSVGMEAIVAWGSRQPAGLGAVGAQLCPGQEGARPGPAPVAGDQAGWWWLQHP